VRLNRQAPRHWQLLVVMLCVGLYGLFGFPSLGSPEPEKADAQNCPYGMWSNGTCRACPVGQVWIGGTGCVVSNGCSSLNHRHGSYGCHRITQSHTTTTTTTAPPPTTTTTPCPSGKHRHAYSPAWCHPDDHLTRPSCHATNRLRYRIHRADSTHQWVYVEPCPPTTTRPPTTTTRPPPARPINVSIRSAPAPCSVALSVPTVQQVRGKLASRCISQNRGTTTRHYFAKRYEITLASSAWLSIDLKSASGQTRSLDTYLMLLSGHEASGRLLELDDDGGVGRNSRLSSVFLPSGDYTIEATSYSASTTGDFILTVGVQTPAKIAGPVTVTGLSAAVWGTAGDKLTLPFSFDLESDNDSAIQGGGLRPYIEAVQPSVLSSSVSLNYSEGSGQITISPSVTRVGNYRIVLGFRKNGSTVVVGRYGFGLRLCPQREAVPDGQTSCSLDTSWVPRIAKLPNGAVSSACIERVPVVRWYVADRPWPAVNSSCTFLDGTSKRPARYFVFEVPFNSAEVTIRLTSSQDTYLMLSRRIVASSGTTAGVDLGTLLREDDNGYRTYGNTNSTDSWITATLPQGMYVAVATIPKPAVGTTPSISGNFTLNIKVPYPIGCSAPSTSSDIKPDPNKADRLTIRAESDSTGRPKQCP